MAQLIGGFCASHAPGQIVRRTEGGEAGQRFLQALDLAARHLRQLRPDVLIICSGDHFTNYSPNAFPQFALGVGDKHVGPAEPWMKIPRTEIPGASDLALNLARRLLQTGFDPTISTDLMLDHGIMTTYMAVDPTMTTPLIPVIQNALVSPMMPLSRCFALGGAIRDAIAAVPQDIKVALIGAGGLSHWIGTPYDGEIDEQFDRWILGRFTDGDIQAILDVPDEELDQAGNGAHEIRSWLVAAGAMSGMRAKVLGYDPVPAWITGMGVIDLIPPPA